MAAQRKLAFNRVVALAKLGMVSVTDITQDPLKFLAAHEIFATTDSAAIYLFSVHFNLFGGHVRLSTAIFHRFPLPNK